MEPIRPRAQPPSAPTTLPARGSSVSARSGSTTATAGTSTAGTSIWKVVLASFIGTAIEWYDFFLYGTAAALVFSKLFFPNVDPLTGTLSAYATYAVGFAARP